jgi:pimeloyl-ACP methyl ester carboxylesterase
MGDSVDQVRSADGTTIAVERTGTGPALVVVAGAFCDRTAFGSLAAVLAGEFTVYRYDRRGRGDSGDTPPYAVDREIDDLAAVIDAAGGSALVLGHSSGAALALAGAARGLPVTKLVAYEAPYSGDEPDPADANFARDLDALLAEGRRSDAAKLFLGRTGMPAEVLEAQSAQPWWQGLVALAHTLPYDVAVVGDRLPRDLLAKVAAPTLAVTGGNSSPWFRNTAEAIAATVPEARSVVLPGQDHNPADSALAPLLTDYFTS